MNKKFVYQVGNNKKVTSWRCYNSLLVMLKYMHVFANSVNVERKLFLYILLHMCTKLSL